MPDAPFTPADADRMEALFVRNFDASLNDAEYAELTALVSRLQRAMYVHAWESLPPEDRERFRDLREMTDGS